MHPMLSILRPLADFLEERHEEVVPRVPGLFPGGAGLVLLAGQSKIGKTWLAIELFVALVTGGSFLGRSITRENAAYIFLEGQPAAVQRRLRLELRGRGVPPGAYVAVPPITLKLDRAAAREAMASEIRTSGAKVVFIDPLSLAHDLEENDNGAMSRLLEALRTMAYELEVLIVFVHHANKMVGDTGMRSIRGATALPAGTEANLVLSERNGRHRLEAALREDRDTVLWLQWDNDQLRFVADATSGDDGMARTSATDRVIEALRSAQTAMSVAELAEATSLSETAVRKIVASLTKNRRVTAEKAPAGKGSRYRWIFAA